MMNKMYILVTILFTIAVTSAQELENKISCEWKPLTLECEEGKMLKIYSANYGRTNASFCGFPNNDTNCRASNSLSIVKDKCEGQTSCTVMAANYVFGDPCYSILKYLEVQYECVPELQNKITCEWHTMSLECKKGEVLRIMSANYGRTNASFCGVPNTNTNCRTILSHNIVKNRCDGQNSCKVMATNYVFGDPCHGIVKYLEVQYQCVPAPECPHDQFRCDNGKCISESLLCNGYPECPEGEDERGCDFENKITCEWQPLTLECEKGEVLKIYSANYGRTNASLCGVPNNDTNCRASNSYSIVRDKCEGQTNCTVMAANYIFGDPCYSIVKYLEVHYRCVPDPTCSDEQFRCDNGKCLNKSMLCNGYSDCPEGEDEKECSYRTIRACEGSTLNVQCASDEVINFVSGNYGRTNHALCEYHYNTNCRSTVANTILKDKCDLRRNCSVASSNAVFGDPCYGVRKYIEMNYYCSQIQTKTND